MTSHISLPHVERREEVTGRREETADALPDGPAPAKPGFLESHQTAALAVFTVLFAAGSYCSGTKRPLWFDELWSHYLARLPDVGSIYSAIRDGIECNPPLYFIAAHFSQRLFGPTELATRLPAAIGFWVMCISLFFFVRKRAGVVCGFIAMLAPFCTYAKDFATEGRPYGAVLGATGLVLLSWQAATEGRHRRAALAGLTLSVALLVSLHYYALYVVGAVAMAELSRATGKCRKIDLPVWLSLGLGCTAMIPYLPLIRAINATKGDFWSKPSLLILGEAYTLLIVPACLVILMAAVLLALRREEPAPTAAAHAGPIGRSEAGLPFREWAACTFLLLMPLVVYLLAVFSTNAFTPRYVMPSVIGFSVLVAVAVGNVKGRFTRFPEAVLGIAFAVFAIGQAWQVFWSAMYQSPSEWVAKHIRVPVPGNLPVVIDDDVKFIQIAHYGTPEQKAHSFFLYDPDYVLKIAGTTTPSRTLAVGRRFVPIQVVDYADFVKQHDTFLLVKFTSTAVMRWTAKHLIEDGADLKLLELYDMGGWSGDETATYLVHMPRGTTTSGFGR